ncbi:hypothetical protein HDK64DRAFT_111796 [Phyllosticta capitalensis]
MRRMGAAEESSRCMLVPAAGCARHADAGTMDDGSGAVWCVKQSFRHQKEWRWKHSTRSLLRQEEMENSIITRWISTRLCTESRHAKYVAVEPQQSYHPPPPSPSFAASSLASFVPGPPTPKIAHVARRVWNIPPHTPCKLFYFHLLCLTAIQASTDLTQGVNGGAEVVGWLNSETAALTGRRG